MRVATSLAALAALAACSSHAPHAAPPAPPPDAAPATGARPDAPPAPAAAVVDPPPPTLRLPTTFAPTHYRARLRVDPTAARFDGEIWIDGALAAPSATVWLNAHALTIDAADAGAGAPLAATPQGDDFLALRGKAPLPAGAVTLHLAYHGAFETRSTAGAFVEETGGARYVTTQFESTYARRVFPSFDEPSSKVPWQLTIEAPAADVAISNTGIEREDKLAGGFVAHHFAETRPLPTYLVAFAVGPYDLVDAGVTRRGAPIRVAAFHGRAPEAAWAAEVTPKLVAALEDVYGVDYPYDKLDIVPIPLSVGFGAMENAGMITFIETGLLVDPKDPSLVWRRRCATTLAHELAHQWFGDLVTPAWWDDIWLNESFATWAQLVALAAVFPGWHADLDAVDQRATALGADGLATARMIRQPIASLDDVQSAFDRITYEKGASLLRAFEQWVGPDKFRRGVHDYLVAHGYGTATAVDFLGAIGAASGADVATPFGTFLDQAGAPRLTATLRCAKGAPPTLALHQERYLPLGAGATTTAPVWRLPVCVVFDRGGARGRACTLLDAADGTLALDAKACPRWVWPDEEGRGYYRAALDAPTLATLTGAAWAKLDVAERLALASDVGAAVARGDLDVGAALDLVPKLAAGSSREVVAAAALAQLPMPYLDGAQARAHAAWLVKALGPVARKLGWTARPKAVETADDERARAAVVPLVATAGDAGLRARAIELAAKWRGLSASIRAEALAVAADDAATFPRLVSALVAEQDHVRRDQLMHALAGVRDGKRLAAALALVIDKRLDPRETFAMLGAVRDEPATNAALLAFVRGHVDELLAGLAAEQHARLAGVLARACDDAARADATKLAQDRLAGAYGGPRAVAQALEAMDQCVARRARLAPALAKRFGR